MSTTEFTYQFEQLRKPLLAFAVTLTRSQDAAQDLLQETAYKAFKYRDAYQPQTNLRAWLMTIMRNAFINEYRKRKRRQTLNDFTPNDYLINSGNETVNNYGESSVMQEEIFQTISELEDWLQLPFLMHYQGYKYDEIAKKMDLPLGTIKSRIFFARKRLQASLKNKFQASEFEDILN